MIKVARNQVKLPSAPRYSVKAPFACIAICALLLIPGMVHAIKISEHVRFANHSAATGLDIGPVEAIAQDSEGFMWLGGFDGLVRYDGYHYEKFAVAVAEAQEGGLSSSIIWDIEVDPAGRVWIGTEDGLNLFDPETRKFSAFKAREGDEASIAGNIVRSLAADDRGGLWIGTFGGLSYLDTKTDTFVNYYRDEADDTSINSNLVTSVLVDSQGYVWAGTDGGGVSRLDPKTGQFERLLNEDDISTLSHNSVRAVFESSQGDIWVGTDSGLNKWNVSTEQFTRYYMSGRPSDVNENFVNRIAEGDYGNLWIASGMGVSIFYPDTEEFTRVVARQSDPASLLYNAVESVFRDKEGGLWFGMFPEGVSYLNKTSMAFTTLQHDPLTEGGLNHNSVLAILEDSEGALWLGTDGGGANVFDPQMQEVKYIEASDQIPSDGYTLSSAAVLSIEEDKKSNIWLGTWGGGLNKLSKDTGRIEHFFYEPGNPTTLQSNNAWTILNDKSDRIWVGTTGGGLSVMNDDGQTFSSYGFLGDTKASFDSPLVWSLYQDENGMLWVGTGAGLNLLDIEKGAFTYFRVDEQTPNSLCDDIINAIYPGSEDTLWLGTRNGLCHFDRTKQLFTSYTTKDGLANDTIMSIEMDEYGDLWLGTLQGLSRFNPDTKKFTNYDQNDGVQGNRFNHDASERLRSGELMFGGTNGVTRFDPKNLQDASAASPVVFRGLRVLNKVVNPGDGEIIDRDINYVDTLTLDYTQSVFTLEYAALSFLNPGKNQYAYKLTGFDEDWNYVEEQRTATYTNLDARRYELLVKAANGGGVWSEPKKLEIVVEPPPWQTWWAYLIYACFVCFIIFLMFDSQRRKIAYQIKMKKRLEKEVKNRTEELRIKNEELEAAYEKLQDISQRDPLTGLFNRRYLYKILPHDLARVIRNSSLPEESLEKRRLRGNDLVFLVVDVDHFKRINDTYGHSNGDTVLRQFSDALSEVSRKTDCIIRWGGEEFLVVCRFVKRANAPNIAERYSRAIEEQVFSLDGYPPIAVTCSIGFACYPFNESKPELGGPEQMIDLADWCLYNVKQNGRNGWMGIVGASDDDINVNDVKKDPAQYIKDDRLYYATSVTGEIELDTKRS